MNVSALLTSAAINVGLCVLLLSLYSILRKQPNNLSVYIGRRLAQASPRLSDPPCFDRFVPSPSWILKAWETPEEDILAVGGLDAVVFLRIVIFGLQVFSVAAFVCIFVVLPVNYYVQQMRHKKIPLESLEVFTIENVEEGSRCIIYNFLVFLGGLRCHQEYKKISTMRLAYIQASSPNVSQFTILVRSIPWSEQKSHSDSVDSFFSNYHGSSYLGHQIVYWSGTIKKTDGMDLITSHTVSDAQKMCREVSSKHFTHKCKHLLNCGLCGGSAKTFNVLSKEPESVRAKVFYRDLDTAIRDKEIHELDRHRVPAKHDIVVVSVSCSANNDGVFSRGRVYFSLWEEEKCMLKGLVFHSLECFLCKRPLVFCHQPVKSLLQTEGLTCRACKGCGNSG